jgi:hypothetical protein
MSGAVLATSAASIAAPPGWSRADHYSDPSPHHAPDIKRYPALVLPGARRPRCHGRGAHRGPPTRFHAHRLLRACQIRDVTEPCAREAARLRTATGQAAAISAADAIVAAYASTTPAPVMLTSDPGDLATLTQHATRPIIIAPV